MNFVRHSVADGKSASTRNKAEGTLIAKLLKAGNGAFAGRNVRLIGADGEQIGLIAFEDAIKKAIEASLDLVLVADKTDPPVCKVMDFGKLCYEQKKNIKAQKRKTVTQKLKEIKFHVSIDEHDYSYKIKHCFEFLEKGCKLKITLMLRGREMAHKDIAFELMNKIIDEVKDFGLADEKPKLLGRNISVTFTPQPKSGKH